MLRSLSTAAAGMDAQQTRLDVTANNIANVVTPGFKKGRAEFEELMSQVLQTPGTATTATTRSPTGLEVGTGVRVSGTQRMQTQGDIKQTGNPLDLAIEGPGYFSIRMPSGETAYTRSGAFKLSAEGHLVTSEGHPLSSDISIPPDAQAVTIGADGTVSALVPGETAPVEAGKIEVSAFPNAAGLMSVGHNLFRETVASGAAVKGGAGQNGSGHLAQGSLEMSNVKVVEEMVDLISGQRAYEVNTRVIKAADEMLQQTVTLR